MTKPECLHADEELKQFLKQSQHKNISADVISRFDQWHKLEEAGFSKNIRAPEVLNAAHSEARTRVYDEYVPDGRTTDARGEFQPRTPANIAQPNTPAPGTAAGRAAAASMTPAGPPP